VRNRSQTPVALAGAVVTVLFWLLGYYSPGLMGTAPQGLEAAATALIMVVIDSLHACVVRRSNGSADNQ
jgi:hypothetical protein